MHTHIFFMREVFLDYNSGHRNHLTFKSKYLENRIVHNLPHGAQTKLETNKMPGVKKQSIRPNITNSYCE